MYENYFIQQEWPGETVTVVPVSNYPFSDSKCIPFKCLLFKTVLDEKSASEDIDKKCVRKPVRHRRTTL